MHFLDRYSVTKQLQILGGLLLLLMLIIAAVITDVRESTYGSVYIATSGEMRMLSQRLAKIEPGARKYFGLQTITRLAQPVRHPAA